MTLVLLAAFAKVGATMAILLLPPGAWAARQFRLSADLWCMAVIGLGLHFSVLLVLTVFTHSLAWVAATGTAFAAATGATWLLLGGLRAKQKPESVSPVERELAPQGLWAAVMLVVVVAAVLRSLHNFHYDDLRHMQYLAELRDAGALFPPGFLIFIASAYGDQALWAARYPFWGAFYAEISQISGVALPETYYVVGLVLLAFGLRVIGGLVWISTRSRAVTIAGVLGFAALWPVRGDELANFGGYPFQVGKLMISIGAVALIPYAASGNMRYAVVSVAALIVGVLCHPNNVIGASMIVAGLAITAAWQRHVALIRATIAAGCILALAAVGHVATDGFLRLKRSGPPTTAKGMVSLSQPQVRTSARSSGKAPRVATFRGRATLFVSRALPVEGLALAGVAAWVVLCGRRQTMRVRATAVGVTVAAIGSLAAVWGLAATRLVVTAPLKPGYFAQAETLRGMAVPPPPALVDSVTAVYLGAQGARGLAERFTGLSYQTRVLLAAHPLVTGETLMRFLRSQPLEHIVVNERVLGPGVLDKYRGVPGATVRLWGGTLESNRPRPDLLVFDALRALQGREYRRLPWVVNDLVDAATRSLWDRPVATVTLQGPRVVPSLTVHDVLRSVTLVAPGGPPLVVPFANSTMASFPLRANRCSKEIRLLIRGTGSFGDTVRLFGLSRDAAGDIPFQVDAPVSPGAVSTVTVPYPRPVCAPGDVRLFAHAGPFYDFRFDITPG